MWQCLYCAMAHEQRLVQCAGCGCKYGVIYLPDLPGSGPLGERNIVTAIEVMQEPSDDKPIPGFEFLGDLPEKFSILLYGAAGSGKSSFALRFANQLAKNNGDTIYFSQEEGIHSATLRRKLRDYQIDAPNLYLSRVENFADIFAVVRGKNTVVIDSLTEMKITPNQLKNLLARVARVVFIVHATKTKIYKGNSYLAHLVDIVLQADSGIVRTESKNRFGEVGKEFRIFPEKDHGQQPQ